MTCEVRVGVALNNVTVLSRNIFSCAADRLAQKMSLYVELWDCVEVYNVVWSLLACNGIFYDWDCLYKIVWHKLKSDLNRIP